MEANRLFLLDLPLGAPPLKQRVLVQLVEQTEQTMSFITSDAGAGPQDVQDLHIMAGVPPEHYNAEDLGSTDAFLQQHADAFEAVLLAGGGEYGQLTQARAVYGMVQSGNTAGAALNQALEVAGACVEMAERQRNMVDSMLKNR